MITVFVGFVGYILGIATYYYVAHKTNPDAAQVTVDAAKNAVTNAIATHVAQAEATVKADISSVL